MADPLTTTRPGEPQSNQDDRTMAALAHGLGVPSSFLIPLIFYFAFKDRSDYVRYHALQATVYQTILAVLMGPIILLTCGVGAVLLLPASALALYLAWQAWEGKMASYPLLDSIGR